MRFQATDDTTQVEISGVKYAVDDKGGFDCDNIEHQPLLRQLGFRGEIDPVPTLAPVVAATPPAIPEGYVSEEAVRALVEENEDMKVAIGKLNDEAATARQVEDQLRDRIQELEAQLAATTE